MRSLALSLSLLAVMPAGANEMIASDGADSVRITQGHCPVSVLEKLPEGTRGHYRKALVVLDGKEYIACWAVRPDGLVHIQYSDGDAGLIPVRFFELVPDA